MVKLSKKLATQLARDLAFGSDALEAIYALSSFSTANRFETQVGGGEPGVASGFGVAVAFQLLSLPSGSTQTITAKTDNASGYKLSWFSGVLRAYFWNGAGGAVSSATFTFAPSDVGRIFTVVAQHTGTAVRLSVLRTPLADVAISGYTPFAGVQTIGAFGTSEPATSFGLIGEVTFRGVLSTAALESLYDTVRATGDLPTAIAGVTVTHKWPNRTQLKTLVAPASIADVVTGATVDAMGKAGAPTVVQLDTSRDGQRTLGVLGASSTSRLETAAGKGIRCAPTGAYVTFFGRLDQQTTDTADMLVSCIRGGASSGYQMHTFSNGTLLYAGAFDSGGTFRNASWTIPASQVGQPLVATISWDGTSEYLDVNGARVATVACASPPPANADTKMMIGHRHDLIAGYEMDRSSGFGVAGGDGYCPSAAEIAAQHVATLKSGRIQPIGDAAKTPHLWDLAQDCLPTESVPAQLLDRIGTDHLTHVGTLRLAQRTERAWSHEASPIVHGVTDFAAAKYLTTAVGKGIGITVASFWKAYLLRVDSVTVSSSARALGARIAATAGWDFLTLGTNTSIRMEVANAAGTYVLSPVISITAADVGKLLLVMCTVDLGTSQLLSFARRAQIAGFTTVSGYKPPAASAAEVLGSPSYPPLGITMIATMGGEGVLPTLAEYHAAHDAAMSAEDLVAIPGKTHQLVSWKNGQLAQQDQVGTHHMTPVGVPTISPHHTRSWAA